jgi:thiol:disulfide interchange protein DsbG
MSGRCPGTKRTAQRPREFGIVGTLRIREPRMRTLHLAIAVVSGALLLAGCKEGPGSSPAKDAVGKTPVTTAAIEAEARGFTVGAPMSVRTVYVFFDPQCPHCAALWRAAKPLKSQAKFIWIPVALLNKTSEGQGAALLAAKDPVATMDEHEASMSAKTGGISAMGDLDSQRAAVVKNTELMNRFGFASVPSIVAMHAQTGALLTREGAMSTLELAAFLGLQPPAGQ